MTESATKIDIAPSLLGLIAKRDLIRPQRAFRFEVDSRNKGTGLMFLVQTDGYYLELTIHPRSIVFKRNSDRLSMRVPSSATKPRRFIVQCGWNPTELSLSVDDLSDVSKSQVRSIPTIATYPPNSLRQWARQEAQFPMSTHESPNAAYEAAIAQLQQLNSKIAETNAINGFWDCYYEGNRLVSKKPKREPDIQPTIRSYLSDLDITKGLELAPEYAIGSGKLDFLLIGRTREGESVYICVEFKLAHSPDLVRGIQRQLPEYMKQKGTDLGIYCVLSFGVDYPPNFPNLPDHLKSDDLEFMLSVAGSRRITGMRKLKPVIIDVSRKTPPSKL